MTLINKSVLCGIAATAILLSANTAFAGSNKGHGNQPVTVYFTRHAEKQTELMELEDQPGKYMEICGDFKCSEILNAKGELRAELLADWFMKRGITSKVTHVYSSHKQRTLQTVEMIAADAGLENDVDMIEDGVQQLPAMNTSELDDGVSNTQKDREGTKATIQPTIDALNALPAGSVAVVAGHSGTIYKIIAGLGIDISSEADFPKDTRPGKEGKVPTFGDIWKLKIHNGSARFKSRINLQPDVLRRSH